jgi:hypothetical protein
MGENSRVSLFFIQHVRFIRVIRRVFVLYYFRDMMQVVMVMVLLELFPMIITIVVFHPLFFLFLPASCIHHHFPLPFPSHPIFAAHPVGAIANGWMDGWWWL